MTQAVIYSRDIGDTNSISTPLKKRLVSLLQFMCVCVKYIKIYKCFNTIPVTVCALLADFGPPLTR